MPTSLDWTNLRPLDNSQQKAFEELCVQLFAAEPPNYARQFVRKGTQDGGIEAYWELLNGDVYGIQAKFFRQAPQTSEWGQIAKSFENALLKHPKLRRYTVCLPIDRGDPKTPGKTSFMDHWNSHVGKWPLALGKSRPVELG
ncbi:MAG TPA: hypothetical protein VIY49_32610 [Bryobacteraceae bacterium]